MKSFELTPGMFDDTFFADYEQELHDIDLQAQAQSALTGILTIQAEDGSSRSYEQIKQEAEAFFANPLVQETEAILDTLSMQYMQFCMAHEGGAMTMNDGELGSVFDRGYALQPGQDGAHKEESKGTRKKKDKNAVSTAAARERYRYLWEVLFAKK